MTYSYPSLNDYKFTCSYGSFAIGALSGVTLKVFGSLYVGEIFAVLYLILRLSKGDNAKVIPRQFLYLAFLWALVQAISDSINDIVLIQSLKGVGAPLILIFGIAGFSLYFLKDINRIPSFLIGLQLGILFDTTVINKTIFFVSNNQWKWAYYGPISTIIIVYTSFFILNRRSVSPILLTFVSMLVLGIIGLANESRGSLSLVLMYVIYLFFRYSIIQRILSFLNSVRPLGSYVLIVLSCLLLYITSLSLGFVLSQGFFESIMSSKTYEKTAKQSASSLGLLAGGRSEFLVSSKAFLEKPILGHGSWAEDRTGFYRLFRINRAYELGEELDLQTSYAQLQYQLSTDVSLIPTHSFLMGALVWGGILAGAFWVYILYWLADTYLRLHSFVNFYFFNGIILLVWNILFSPFGYSTRFSTAIFISTLLVFAHLCYMQIGNKRQNIR
jgi:hypothetical protein